MGGYMKDWDKHWTKEAEEQLLGRKIVKVRYMSRDEADDLGWYSRPVVMQLDDGNLIYCSCDDEGNDGGALFFTTKDGKHDELPVL